jgi:F-type H+-transporting ATPase subunit c
MANGIEQIDWARSAALISAGICMGLGAIGPSIGQGYIGGKACEAIGKKPESSSAVSKAMLMGCVFTETSSIYALLISLILILFV